MMFQFTYIVLLGVICVVFAPQNSTSLRGFYPKWSWKSLVSNRKIPFIGQTGTGSNLIISPGDTVMSISKAQSTPEDLRAYQRHAFQMMFAVTDEDVIAFYPGKGTKETTARMVEVRTTLKDVELVNFRKKAGQIWTVGVLVGTLMVMSKAKMPYNLFYCNGNHYVQYLSGRRGFLPLSKSCPLWAPLSSENFTTIFESGSFTLKKGNRREIHLVLPETLLSDEPIYNRWPKYIRDRVHLKPHAENDQLTGESNEHHEP